MGIDLKKRESAIFGAAKEAHQLKLEAQVKAQAFASKQPKEAKQQTQPSSEQTTDKSTDDNWHNNDFTEVLWNGKKYKFNTPQQTLAVEYLWANKRAREKSIGEAIGSEADNFRLIHIFRQKRKKAKMHPAWGKMIIPDGKGVYALAEKKNPPKK